MTTTTTLVSEVMTPAPICVRPEAPVKEIAETLTRQEISAVAVVDRGGTIVGVVSEVDLVRLLRPVHHGRGRRRSPVRPRTARDVMTSPALTVAADEPVSVVAGRFAANGPRRLFVVADGRPVGVVARRDLVEAFSRPDADIERDVTALLRTELRLGPRRVRAVVRDGVVTIAGRVERRSEVTPVTAAVEAIPGVVSVSNGLDYVWDNT
ncbi:CBS domain-containing protein [Amycolatopsis rhabdoformis]|uniref:CBS domain-containing protein n=1 Tax=Amycolatopsis rhabdoformis TaxID=1448059 RepID=A0ABZ1ICH9_9PSEU|nr:CBS domain-containing protein [Amycolatopsis rhabdoformis]WSE32174.1 CBS domain-containing protein [Amycolatopsis rhabdoformis]